MQRYFVNEKKGNVFSLNRDDSFHVEKVMRMHISDKIEIVYNEKVFVCKIIKINNGVVAEVLEEKIDNNELDVHVILCQALVNEQKMDFLLQKCVELGAYSFYPVKMLNCVIKENNKSSKKIERWQRIVKEASEQSKRNVIPKVHDIIDLKSLALIPADVKLMCSVNETTKNMKKVLSSCQDCATMIIVVGPEGGFKPDEEKFLMENGFISVSLGKRVLRTETAGLSALSMINYEWMV